MSWDPDRPPTSKRRSAIEERVRLRRKLASGSTPGATPASASNLFLQRGIHVLSADGKRRGQSFAGKKRWATIGVLSRGKADPAAAVVGAIREALDPTKANGKARSFADMTPEERAKVAAELGAPISQRSRFRP